IAYLLESRVCCARPYLWEKEERPEIGHAQFGEFLSQMQGRLTHGAAHHNP
ncbi:unnamed protein product, partial [Symbiodinium sp. CCMP2592]